jgi:glycosyltransferase involved in cell wall biosynthesis
MSAEVEGHPLACLSVVIPMWNVEAYGFPWREVLCEFLGSPVVSEVVVVVPGNSTDDTVWLVREWAQREPRLKYAAAPAVEKKEDIAAITNEGIRLATGTLVFSAQADELLEMTDELVDHILDVAPTLNDMPVIVGFPRLDFTWSASYVEPVWDEQPPVFRLFGKKHFPGICARDDAMHVDGPGSRAVWDAAPIFHYHGLSEDSVWRMKEVAFQELFGMRDERLLSPDRSAFKDRHDRAYPLRRRHPHIMGPWLSRSDLARRDYHQMELKHEREARTEEAG